MALKLVTGPSAVVTLAELKKHVRAEDFTDDDDYLQTLAEVATGWIDAGEDGWLGRAIGTQTWDYVLDAFPTGTAPFGGGIKLPFPPLQSVTSVTYVSPDTGLDVTLTDGTDYEVDLYSTPGWVMPGEDGWPTPMETINAVKVRFVAGYTTVPRTIRHAIKLMVGHLYKNRESTTAERPGILPMGAEALLLPHRFWHS